MAMAEIGYVSLSPFSDNNKSNLLPARSHSRSFKLRGGAVGPFLLIVRPFIWRRKVKFRLFAHCCIFTFGSLFSVLRTGSRTFPWSRLIQNYNQRELRHRRGLVADQRSRKPIHAWFLRKPSRSIAQRRRTVNEKANLYFRRKRETAISTPIFSLFQ